MHESVRKTVRTEIAGGSCVLGLGLPRDVVTKRVTKQSWVAGGYLGGRPASPQTCKARVIKPRMMALSATALKRDFLGVSKFFCRSKALVFLAIGGLVCENFGCLITVSLYRSFNESRKISSEVVW